MPSSSRRGRSLLSPSGFAFVTLCFFLPFLTLSCESGMGDLHVTYTGIDLAFDGTPTIEGSLAEGLSDTHAKNFQTGMQLLVLSSLAVAGLGFLLTLLVPHRPTQLFFGLIAAVVSLGALVTDLVRMFQEHGELLEGPGTDTLGVGVTDTGIGLGLWLALGLLVFLVPFHIVAFGRSLKKPKASAVHPFSDLL